MNVNASLVTITSIKMNAMMTITTMGNTIPIMMSVREIDILTITRKNVKESQEKKLILNPWLSKPLNAPRSLLSKAKSKKVSIVLCKEIRKAHHLKTKNAHRTKRLQKSFPSRRNPPTRQKSQKFLATRTPQRSQKSQSKRSLWNFKRLRGQRPPNIQTLQRWQVPPCIRTLEKSQRSPSIGKLASPL